MVSQDPRRARLEELDLEILRLQTERQILIESLTFPVATLPVEITSQIFVHCLTEPHDLRNASTSDAPLVLARVCRRWRDIALSVPELWTSWSLATDGGRQERVSYSLKLWLARSKNRPLSIRLHYKDGTSGEATSDDEDWWERGNDYADKVLPILREHCRQWENIEFNVPLGFLRGSLGSFIPAEGLPVLRHLTLGSSQEDWSVAGGYFAEGPITLFMEAPQLTSLHLILERHTPGLDVMDHVDLPFTQLTSFTGTSFSIPECLFVLGQTPLLVDCTFSLDEHASSHPFISIEPLQNLKLFKLWSAGSRTPLSYSGRLLAHLTLPSLETLALECSLSWLVIPFLSRI
jgi:hypothetical protein